MVLAVAGWQYDAAAAAAWGAGFRLPSDVGARDMSLFSRCNHNLVDAVRCLRRTTGADRLNRHRALDCVPPDDPDFDRVLDLATSGIRVHTTAGFRPNNVPPPLRQLYIETSGAVNRMLYELHQANLLFILPRAYVMTHLSHTRLHFSPLHWAKKSGKLCGRPIFDASDDKYGALNSEDASLQAEQYYGRIQHPTLTEIVVMILDFQDEMTELFGDLFHQSQLLLFKHDLRRAFMLLDFADTDVHLLATLLTDDLVAIHHTGVFGLGGMPFAFQTATRAIQAFLLYALRGKSRMYVDDIIGITLRSFLQADNTTVVSFCRRFLGSQAIAEDKSESGRVLDVIGWRINLDSQTVCLSNKNLATFGYHLLNLDLTKKVSVTELQRIASYASRSSVIYPVMKVFNYCIYGNFAGVRNHKALQQWHPDAIVAIQLWRVVLAYLHFNEDRCARPMASFRKADPSFVITFDASLFGCGFVLREFVGATTTTEGVLHIMDTGAVVSVGKLEFNKMVPPINFGVDSKFQNTAEFIAVVFAVTCLRERGISNVGLALRGDSATALAWSSTGKFKSLFAKPAALVFLLLCLEDGLDISLSEHICAARNDICDGLSRSASVEEACYALNVDCTTVMASVNERVSTLVSFCNSDFELTDFMEVTSFWKEVGAVVSS